MQKNNSEIKELLERIKYNIEALDKQHSIVFIKVYADDTDLLKLDSQYINEKLKKLNSDFQELLQLT